MTQNAKIHVILAPGADALTFDADIIFAGTIGATVEAMAFEPVTGHPIDGRKVYFDAVADRISEAVERAKRARVFGIGRNHGGSLLAYAAARDGGFDGWCFRA